MPKPFPIGAGFGILWDIDLVFLHFLEKKLKKVLSVKIVLVISHRQYKINNA